MTTLTEGQTPGDFLLFEETDHYSRDEVTIASGDDLQPGTVLGKITTGGKYKKCVKTANDGSQNAVAVLYTPAKAADADVSDAVIIARHARVRRGGLIFDTTQDDETKRNAVVAALQAKGILVL